MGYWGYGPLDSDQALDWVDVELVGQTLLGVLERESDDLGCGEQRAAIEVLLLLRKAGLPVTEVVLTKAEDFLDGLRQNEEAMQQAAEPEEFRRAVGLQMAAVHKAIHEKKEKR